MAGEWGISPAITPDWPVAQIPTEPTATHPGGQRMPLRWTDHGDLWILVDVDTREVFITAADLIALAELDDVDDTDLHPTIRPTVTWWKHTGGNLVEHYTLADAVTLLQHTPTHQTGELLAWMRDTIPSIVSDDVLDATVGLESFCRSYTVQQAAMILDRDPAITTGRQRLFEILEHHGWIHRGSDGHWAPTSTARQHHWVTLRPVTIRAGRASAPYLQVYITPDGLAELRRLLHALYQDAPATLTDPEQLPLP